MQMISAQSVERSPRHVEIVEAMLADPSLADVNFDISWDEVARYAVSSPETVARVAALLNKYPDRFLFGTDTVAPASAAAYYSLFEMWEPIWRQLTPETSLNVRMKNYERLFDDARRKVRAWEKANIKEKGR